MRIRKNIYIITGVLLILLNLFVDLAEYIERRSVKTDPAYSIGYFIGSHLLLILGILLLRIAYKIHLKMKRNDVQQMIEEIGKS